MADAIRWAWGPGEQRFAVVAGGRVVEFLVDRPDMVAGTVFAGRVTEVNPALDAAFVEIGLDRPGFLPGAKALGVSRGMAVTVRAKAEPRGGKGAALAPADGAPLGRPHPLERLLARFPAVTRVVADDAGALAEARRFFRAAEPGPWEADEAWEQALSPVVPLASGGRVLIEHTAALTAVDVDSGAGPAQAANREAVAELARQLRLRGVGGQVVVDFVKGAKREAYKLAAAVKRAVAEDPTPTHVFGVSPLGLVELSRERRGASLAEAMLERSAGLSARSAALLALRRLLAEAAHRPAMAPVLRLAPDVAAALDRDALAEVERRLGRPISVRSEATRSREDFGIGE